MRALVNRLIPALLTIAFSVTSQGAPSSSFLSGNVLSGLLSHCTLTAELEGSTQSFETGFDTLVGNGEISCTQVTNIYVLKTKTIRKQYIVSMRSFLNVVYEPKDKVSLKINSVNTTSPHDLIEALKVEGLENLNINEITGGLSFYTSGGPIFLLGNIYAQQELVESLETTLNSYLHFSFIPVESIPSSEGPAETQVP